MPSMTLSIPEDLHSFIKRHNEIRWSEIARRAMWDYAKRLEILDRIAEKSKLTEKDVEELDRMIKKAVHKHYRKYTK
ncbi:MAG: hypothetical protein JSW00_14495 [Thermoplasmata archaeon]|nr:MAG: hypothetical protein JSW00_14495 [Thermoplasmata archaeon]